MVLLAFCGGALDLGGNVLLVAVWRGHPWAASAMNLLHFTWGIGSFLSPILAEAVGTMPSIYFYGPYFFPLASTPTVTIATVPVSVVYITLLYTTC